MSHLNNIKRDGALYRPLFILKFEDKKNDFSINNDQINTKSLKQGIEPKNNKSL